jgi:hypothetical protein
MGMARLGGWAGKPVGCSSAARRSWSSGLLRGHRLLGLLDQVHQMPPQLIAPPGRGGGGQDRRPGCMHPVAGPRRSRWPGSSNPPTTSLVTASTTRSNLERRSLDVDHERHRKGLCRPNERQQNRDEDLAAARLTSNSKSFRPCLGGGIKFSTIRFRTTWPPSPARLMHARTGMRPKDPARMGTSTA